MHAGITYVMGRYDNGGPNTGPTEMQTGRLLDIVVQYSQFNDRGLDSDKAFHTSIRCVATACRELCVTMQE